MKSMRDTETLNRIERLANEFIWQNEWLGVLNVSKTTDGEVIKIQMAETEFYRLAKLADKTVMTDKTVMSDSEREYFFEGPYMFFTLV